MHQDYKETNGMRNDEVNKSNLVKIHGPLFPSRRTALKEVIFGRSCWMKMLLTIDGSDDASFD